MLKLGVGHVGQQAGNKDSRVIRQDFVPAGESLLIELIFLRLFRPISDKSAAPEQVNAASQHRIPIILHDGRVASVRFSVHIVFL